MSFVQEILNALHAQRLEKSLKHALASLLGWFLPHERVGSVPLESIRNILVIRQHNQLGDMLCAVPLLRALRQRFPSARIDLVASPVNYEVMLNNPFIDEVILYDKFQFIRMPWRFISFRRKLRARHYDLAIVPSTVSMSFTSDAMAYLSGAKYRIGAASMDGVENIASHFFNVALELDWNKIRAVHQTERNLQFVHPLRIVTDDLGIVVRLTEEEKKFAAHFLSKYLDTKKVAIGLHPGAGIIENRWPAERFARVAERLAADMNTLIVITCGPLDHGPVQRMIEALSCDFVLVKNISIRRVAAIINRLSLYITNDTGVMHVASATSTRVLSLMRPSKPSQWAPRGYRHRFLVSQTEDIASITEEEVFLAARKMLKAR